MAGNGASGLVEDAAKDRIEGERPGRVRALAAAAVAGAAAAAVAYKFLRSEDGGGDSPRSAPRRSRARQRTPA